MSHRPKHRRANWSTPRLERALERARKEGERPAPKPRERQRHRVLPVSSFLAMTARRFR